MTPPLILTYHAISDSWLHRLAVTQAAFARHLTLLRDRGDAGLTFADAEKRRQDGSLPPRAVLITFDDGFASVLCDLPFLEAVRWPATVFVATRFVDSGDPLRWPGLDAPRADDRSLEWSEIERLIEVGWEIGSHTATICSSPGSTTSSSTCSSGVEANARRAPWIM